MTINKAQEIEVVDFNRKYNWDCSNWTVEESFFKIPEEIKFIEIENGAVPASDD